VALILREAESGLELLFIQRAERDGDPWSGHVGFPGGRAEPGDLDLGDTAERETAEEIGLDLVRDAERLGALDELRAMARMRPLNLVIAPFVYRVHGPAELALGPEVRSVHWLPLDEIRGARWLSTMEYAHQGTSFEFPCLRFDGLMIWGLTFRMFTNFRELLDAAPAAAQEQRE
jgi:8-oxo-dGTP pyrophosphatase MutT (NUDIX family)